MSKKYVLVTAFASYRMRYCVPVDVMDNAATELEQINWASDSVILEEVKEFSQHYLDELISDAEVLSEEQILKQFDKDNAYLSGWTKEQKLAYINKWKDDLSTP